MLRISDNLPAKPSWNYKRTPRGWDTEVHRDGGRKTKVLRMGQKWT
jgi:hypothetical protein